MLTLRPDAIDTAYALHTAGRSARAQRFLSVLALCCACMVPHAVQGQVRISFQTGGGLSTGSGELQRVAGTAITLDDNVKPGFIGSFAARASVIVPLFQNAGLQFGVAYAKKGMNEVAQEYPWQDIRMRLDYLELPVLFRYSPAPLRTVSPYFAIGPAFSILIDCVEKIGERGLGLSLDCPGSSLLNQLLDIGAIAGGGINVALSDFWSVSLSGYYNHGLSSLFTTGDVKSRAFSVVAGFSIPIRCRCD